MKDVSLFCDIERETWFRGQSCYIYELTPGIFRDKFNEAEMYDEFIRRYPDHSNSHKNIFEWLTLMQHYGLPTRLLDWSTNLLVALFFCCNEDKDKDGAVFVFNPTSTLSNDHYLKEFLDVMITSRTKYVFFDELIKVTDKKFGEESKINGIPIKAWRADYCHRVNVYNDTAGASEFSSLEEWHDMPSANSKAFSERLGLFSKIYSFKPPHLNPRIRQQHGCFTFHGGKYFKEEPCRQGESLKFVEFIKVKKMEDHRNDLVKIKVRSTDKGDLLKELALSGITEATLFPEMEYQAKQIKEHHKHKYI